MDASGLFAIFAFIVFVVAALIVHRQSGIKAEKERQARMSFEQVFERRAEEQRRHELEKNRLALQQEREAKQAKRQRELDQQRHASLVDAAKLFQINEVSLKIDIIEDASTVDEVVEEAGDSYQINTSQLTCTCERFLKEKYTCEVTEGARLCEHLFQVLDSQGKLDWTTEEEYTVLFLGTREKARKAYSLFNEDDGWFYIIIGKDNEWINVYSRPKFAGLSAFEGAGEFERYGWSLNEKRWSMGNGPKNKHRIQALLRNLNDFEDLTKLLSIPLSQAAQEKTPLSIISDPRTNPDYSSDKYGPKTDAYDRPNNLISDVLEFEGRILFSYIDGKGQHSRRTVRCRELQTYRSAGDYLYAWCELRKEGRTFDVEKISDIFDPETGEIIDDIKTFAEFQANNSVSAQLRKWASENEPLARAWLYLVKGNKNPTSAEYKVLKDVFEYLLDDVVITTKDIRKYHEEMTITTAIGFQRLTASIIKHHPEKVDIFTNTSRKLVNARKKPNFADLAALHYLEERLTKK